jgi:hypothetical protein
MVSRRPDRVRVRNEPGATVQTIHVSSWLMAIAASAPLAAQTVHRVGPGQPFATIEEAIQAATTGDVVEVLAGNYPAFVLNKALTIRAEPVGAVVTASSNPTPNYVMLPAGGHARLCGPWPSSAGWPSCSATCRVCRDWHGSAGGRQ